MGNTISSDREKTWKKQGICKKESKGIGMSRKVKITWSTYYSFIIVVLGFLLWIYFKFAVYVFGFHIHHFYFGLFYLIFGLYSITMQRKRYTAKMDGMIIQYNAVPWLMIALGLFMLITDIPDFISFLTELGLHG